MEKFLTENDVALELNQQAPSELKFEQEVCQRDSTIVDSNDETSSVGHGTGNTSLDQTPHVYEVENMERDEVGHLVVKTSKLATTVIHVDDDTSLSPWTFRTFFIGRSVTTRNSYSL